MPSELQPEHEPEPLPEPELVAEHPREATEINNHTLLVAFKDRIDGGRQVPKPWRSAGAPGERKSAAEDAEDEFSAAEWA